MSEREPLDPTSTAVVLVDMQVDVVEGRGWTVHPPGDQVVAACAALATLGRAAGAPVIYTKVEYQADGSNTPQAIASGTATPVDYLVEGTAGTEIVSELTPRAGEVVAVKNLVSGFDASGFEAALRAGGVNAFVIGGIATHGGVEATVRDGAEKGYRVVVVRECCGGLSEEAHANSLDEVFPPIAEVVALADVAPMLGGAGDAAS